MKIADASQTFDTADPESGFPQAEAPKTDATKGFQSSASELPPKRLFIVPATIFAIASAALVVGSIALVKINELVAETAAVSDDNVDKLEGSKTLEDIIQRQKLRCGVVDVPLFAEIDERTGEADGFDVDLCRAVAAALFGHDNYEDKVEFDFLLPEENKFYVLVGDEAAAPRIDLLASIVTHTFDRDVWQSDAVVGLTFSTPYLHDGIRFGGHPEFVQCADQRDIERGVCPRLKICVHARTTAEDYIKDLFPLENTQVLNGGHDSFGESFNNGDCNVVAADGLIASSFLKDVASDDVILGESHLSREPLAIVTRQDDARFSDFVNWVVQALIFAEEQGISQSQAIHRIAPTPYFGEQFQTMFADAVAAVGNYGDLYERHFLSSLGPREAGWNSINSGSSGLIFSHPFGALENKGPSPVEGSTIQKIKERGHLNCGITRRTGFGVFDPVNLQWGGFDVDYCKALAAALFDGSVDHVVYHVLPATERFKVQEMGDVDVLSRITTFNLERDVLEPTTMQGFTFSQPVFYDGMKFGGVPNYAQCAENLQTSDICSDLRICVNDGTTTKTRVFELFPESNIVIKPTGEEAVAGLATEECNVIAGVVHTVARESVQAVGYWGEYTIGSKTFSKEPLALVTRQSDPQFSDFVYWVVASTFYAEENGISFVTAEEMPTTNLFGPLYSRMFINAIQAVGSHGDIYSLNVEAIAPRSGLNLLNQDPFGPQMYPLPGIQLL